VLLPLAAMAQAATRIDRATSMVLPMRPSLAALFAAL